MADPDLEVVHPANASSSQLASSKSDLHRTRSDGRDVIPDIDNVEKARAIAEQDLHGPRKQVQRTQVPKRSRCLELT